MKCFNCQQDGHMAWECKWQKDLTAPGDAPAERLLAQYARCIDCAKIIYAWDRGIPCDRHRVVTEWHARYAEPGIYRPSARKPPQPSEDHYRRLAAEQVAEARAARAVLG